jgi:hypothetical protein
LKVSLPYRGSTGPLNLLIDSTGIKVKAGLIGKYIDVYEYGGGCIQVRAHDVVLPHTVMNQERRIMHAAITENKRLSAGLAHIKVEQDKAPTKVKIKPESDRNGYTKTGKRPLGRPSKMEGTTPANVQKVMIAKPARAPISEVYTLAGGAIISGHGDISALRLQVNDIFCHIFQLFMLFFTKKNSVFCFTPFLTDSVRCPPVHPEQLTANRARRERQC